MAGTVTINTRRSCHCQSHYTRLCSMPSSLTSLSLLTFTVAKNTNTYPRFCSITTHYILLPFPCGVYISFSTRAFEGCAVLRHELTDKLFSFACRALLPPMLNHKQMNTCDVKPGTLGHSIFTTSINSWISNPEWEWTMRPTASKHKAYAPYLRILYPTNDEKI